MIAKMIRCGVVAKKRPLSAADWGLKSRSRIILPLEMAVNHLSSVLVLCIVINWLFGIRRYLQGDGARNASLEGLLAL